MLALLAAVAVLLIGAAIAEHFIQRGAGERSIWSFLALDIPSDDE